MQITLNDVDLSRLKPATRQDLASLIASSTTPDTSDTDMEGFDFTDVARLTLSQVQEFVEGCSEKTVAGLRIFAEHGPKISADLLNEAGIENYGHFQGRVTQRTRTVTGYKHAYLFSWDDWTEGENGDRGFGHYVVTPETYSSLRQYFELD